MYSIYLLSGIEVSSFDLPYISVNKKTHRFAMNVGDTLSYYFHS